jgi:mono/diheme cytochrome c family protein
VSLSSALAACGSGGGGGAAPPAPGGGGGGGGGGGSPLLPTFASIQAQVFTPICTACHIGATAPLGLRLDAANSYALLVGVTSVQEPGFLRVEAGDPNDSYLIRKLEGTQTVGGRMPLGGTPLTAANIAVIRQWILDGAQATPTPAPTAPIRVTSLSPLPGTSLPPQPLSVVAVFDRELNATTVDATTFRVQRSGGDGSFGDGNEVDIAAASVTVPLANPTTALFDMSNATAANDTYRITLVGTGTAILDLGGNALDGEFAGSFPSGNGTAGGDFTALFTVAGIEPTLTSIQSNVFTPICSVCHNAAPGPGVPPGLDLTSVNTSFASLVNVASVQVGTLDRVEPANPNTSYLVQKIEGTAAVGVRMPFGGTPLDAATIAAIRQWIANGAAM